MIGEHDRRRRDPGREGRARAAVEIDLSGESSALDDDALLERALGGDARAFVELYRRHEELTWRVARATSLSDDDAVEAVVDAFVQLVEGRRERTSTFRALLAGTARQAALDRMDRRRVVRRPLTDTPGDVEIDLGREALIAASDPEELLKHLPTALPPPPPELWAVVQVAWDDVNLHNSGAFGPSA